jgi:hypothetical protein
MIYILRCQDIFFTNSLIYCIILLIHNLIFFFFSCWSTLHFLYSCLDNLFSIYSCWCILSYWTLLNIFNNFSLIFIYYIDVFISITSNRLTFIGPKFNMHEFYYSLLYRYVDSTRFTYERIIFKKSFN